MDGIHLKVVSILPESSAVETWFCITHFGKPTFGQPTASHSVAILVALDPLQILYLFVGSMEYTLISTKKFKSKAIKLEGGLNFWFRPPIHEQNKRPRYSP